MSKYPKTSLALLAMLLYFPTLFFGWVYLDDYLIVQEAGFYAKLSNIPASFLRSVWHPTGNEYNYYRPASISVYIFDAWISNTLSQEILPWAFHLTNLLLQGAVAALLFAFFRAIGGSLRVSMIATLAFAWHPAVAGTIGWISGQNELLLAVWVLGGFLCFIRAMRSVMWFVPHGMCLLMALLTKENALALPVLCSLFLLCGPDRRSMRIWLAAIAAWVLTGLIWILMVRQGGSQQAPAAGSALQGMLHGAPYLLIYLGKWTLPFGLSTLPTPQDTAWYTWLAGGLTALGIAYLLLFKARRKPLLFLGAAWFIGFLLPTFANMVPELKESFILRADRGYLASAGLVIMLVQLDWSRIRSRAERLAMFALVALWPALNFAHQYDYQNGMRFYQSAVRGSPRSAFAHAHLGDMYLAEKDFQRAIAEYQEAIRLNDREPNGHNNLGVAYMRMGEWDKAAAEFQKELAHNPKNLLAWSNIGSIYLRRGDHENAEAAFAKAVEINPAYKDAWIGLVQVYTFLRQEQKRAAAEKMLQKAEMDMSRGL